MGNDGGYQDLSFQRGHLSFRQEEGGTQKSSLPIGMTNRRENMLGFASGLVAGIVGVITGYPMDVAKTRAQVFGGQASLGLLPSKTSSSTSYPLRIARHLFRGIAPPLVTTGIVQTINFGVYDNILRYLQHQRRLQESERGEEEPYAFLQDYFLAGAVGGISISFITCPASLVKIQMQTNTSKEVTYWSILKSMSNKGLSAGYYRAYIPDVLNQCFGRGVYMASYEGLKHLMASRDGQTFRTTRDMQQQYQQPMYQRIVAAALSGIAGWLVIYPLDVVKSRMQADALSPHDNKYKNMMDCFRQSYRTGGWRSLYSGLTFTLMRAVPVASIILPTYDITYQFLATHLRENKL